MNRRWLLLGLCPFLISPPVAAERVLKELSWRELSASGAVAEGEVLLPGQGLAASEAARPDQLRLESTSPRPRRVAVVRIDDPGLTAREFALRGEVRYAGLAGEGFLEMLVGLPDGSSYFSRTLDADGPTARLTGDSPWREFALPFFILEGTERPTWLQFNVVFPGEGTVWLGPLRLEQYGAREAALGAGAGRWRLLPPGGRLGVLLGLAMGVVGGLIGWLGGSGRSKRVVFGLVRVMFGLGVIGLVAAAVAIFQARPFAVSYALLICGVIGVLLPRLIRPALERRYETAGLEGKVQTLKDLERDGPRRETAT